LFHALFVDDDPDHTTCVRAALAEGGCVETCDGTAPDLIVIAFAGPEVSRVTELAARFPEIPILVVCDAAAIGDAFLAGAADGVTRPPREEELVARVRLGLRRRADHASTASRERKKSETMVRLQREKQDLERLVCVDSLTGVANRRHALALLDLEWRRSAREHSGLALVMIDLDCYHAFNERYGHLGGDSCLQQVADAMVTSLRRPSDFLGRYGGEEFIAVLPNTDGAGAKIVAERLRASVEALAIPHVGSACSKVVTITAGFAAMEVRMDLALDALIAAADGELLRAKAAGRNRIEGVAGPNRHVWVSASRWQRFAPVFTDPWFANRVPAFLADIRYEVTRISDAVRLGELQPVREIVRHVKTAAIEYGFQEILRMGDELEQAAESGDGALLGMLADELLQYVLHVQVVYRRRLEASITLPTLLPA
jgi:diguanylate cyclase (GGDEF)-like protein